MSRRRGKCVPVRKQRAVKRSSLRTGNLWYAVVLVVMALGVCGCNARKNNTAAARQYTAFITRYNIYYNGDKHYTETLADMEKNYEDDYTSQLFMHPAEAKAHEKAPQPSGDFNRSIEKAQKAIQLRSITKKPKRKPGKSNDPEYKAWLKRDEYNPFLHNAWMMMGRSQYMNGDYLGAASTFFYTSRHFSWLPNTVVEAQLWQARSYLAMDWLFEAETIMNRIKPDQLNSREAVKLYNFDYADLRLREKNYAQAVPYLIESVKHASGIQKTRLRFLLGQVYARLGRKKEAYEQFKKVGGANSVTYRTKFNARIKQSEVFEGNNIESEVKALRRMTRFDRNKEYLDQIYYAIGNLYLSRGDTAKAIENYRLAAEKSTRSGIDKAISQITLGTLYYDRHQYELAQPCYAEAVPLLPDDYPGLDTLKRRSDVLDELAVYSQNVTLQDSLLRLAQLDSVQQLAVVNKIIDELKKKEKEEADAARREAYLADQAAQGSNLQQNNTPSNFTMNTDNSWYFYNTQTRNAGKTEFQRRWGSRKLEDNWRRRNKSSFSLDDNSPGEEDEQGEGDGAGDVAEEESPEDAEAAKRADDPHYPEFYLKQIPNTPEQKVTANDVIQEGLYNMGVILKDKLDDPSAAISEFNRLLKDYPDNVYRLDTYYNLYLIFMRAGDKARAEEYRQLILKDFADSKYGQALRNPDYIDNLRRMDSEQEALYERAWQSYLDNDNNAVHGAYDEISGRFPMSKLMPKFMFLHALAYATEKKPEQFQETLRDMLERYPDTDVAPIASAWVKGLAAGRQLQTGTGGQNMRGMLWEISLGNDSTANAGDGNGPQFSLDNDSRQYLVFVFPTDRVSQNELLYELARFNFSSFVVQDFDLEPMNFGLLGMIVVKSFDNLGELNHYRRVMASSPNFRLPRGVMPVVISQANFDELLRSGASLETYFRYLEEQNYKDAQSDILPYEAIEELGEREEHDAEEAASQSSGSEAAPAPEETTPEELPTAKPEPQPELTPEPAPSEQPTATPAAKPETKPAPKPETKPAPKPAQKPVPRPAPKPAPKPVPSSPLPAYDPGSEGDDPLLE